MRLLGRAVAGDVREVASRDSIAFVSSSTGVGSGPRGLSIFDCRIPANPHILSTIFSYAQGVSVDGNYAFVHRGDSTFSLDISNLTCPQVLGRVNHPSPNYNGATESLTKGGIVFWTSGGEFGLINVADANAPRSLFEAEISGSGGIDVVNDTIYVTRPDGLWIFRYRRSSTDFREQNDQSRTQTQLAQNYPNPFNPTTTIDYQLPTISQVKLTVYDLLGREVATLIDDVKGAGTHSVTWDASQFASGAYLVRMTASAGNAAHSQTRKIVLMK